MGVLYTSSPFWNEIKLFTSDCEERYTCIVIFFVEFIYAGFEFISVMINDNHENENGKVKKKMRKSIIP